MHSNSRIVQNNNKNEFLASSENKIMNNKKFHLCYNDQLINLLV